MPKNIIISKITQLLNLPERSVKNTIQLIEDGATIPFIARYRKEATDSLDEVEIGNIAKSWTSFNELIKRKEFVLGTIKEQGKLNDSLRTRIEKCWDATTLEDLYLPYKKKRKTRATMAREKGLEPLANTIYDQKERNLHKAAQGLLSKEVATVEEALQGARDIIAERINEDKRARDLVRRVFQRTALIKSKVVKKKLNTATKYKDYFDYKEPAAKTPAHRWLAVMRGEKEGLLKASVDVETEEAIRQLGNLFILRNASTACGSQMRYALEDGYKRLLQPSMETEFRNLYKEKADTEAIKVFSENLKQLLLAPPLGTKAVMGIDPGFRTGCKVVCLNKNGDLVHNTAIYPHPPQNKQTEAKSNILGLCKKYKIEAIAIGNGTAGKETYAMAKGISFNSAIEIFMVNEAGASIYSASEIARTEFPDHDVTVRGAVSIARRLMDPLSELVKIEPKSIGVGQYQHDVNQTRLKEDLTSCVASAVNAVGIDLNTASEHVLTYVSGLGPVTAKNVVNYRSEHGSFQKISTLKKVPRLGAKAFEQCAGFLRVRDGENSLDNTGVHPERYKLVQKMIKDQATDLETFIASKEVRSKLNLQSYESEEVGLPTLNDIMQELDKPGLDIRGSAKVFEFTPGLQSIADLRVGMRLKGIINNVTKFGAFVDIGIKEAGLIHVSQMADKFVKDPLEVVKLNQEVYAKVIELDVGRKRISLSLKV